MRDYKTLKYSDTEFLMTKSDDNGKNPGGLCYKDICNKYFYVTYGKQYFFVANFSYNTTQTATFEILDLSARYL